MSRGKQWRSENPERVKELRRQWQKKNAENVLKHKIELGCSFCGYNKFGGALEWHHPNNDKDYVMSTSAYFTPKGRIERSKCILLCANCHREEHDRLKRRTDLDDLKRG